MQRNRTLTLAGLKARADTFSAAMVACSKALGRNGRMAFVAVLLAASIDQLVKRYIYICIMYIIIYYAYNQCRSGSQKGMGFHVFYPEMMLAISTKSTAFDVYDFLPTL